MALRTLLLVVLFTIVWLNSSAGRVVSRKSLKQQMKKLEKDLKKAEANILNNQEDIGDNAAQIAGNMVNITNNNGDILDNAAQIEVLKPLKQKTKKLTKDLDQAEANMLNVQATVVQIGNDISNNDAAINDNAAQIARNAIIISNNTNEISNNNADISDNAAQIAGNTIEISNNTNQISYNEDDISDNAAKIASNTINISNNSNEISYNNADINDNAAQITNNTIDIINNTYAINMVDNIEELYDEVFNNSANIAQNMVEIQNNTNLISMSALCPEGTCSNHGTCNITTGSCFCDSGYHGAGCSIVLSDIVRLKGGNTLNEGFIEIQGSDGKWGGLCDSWWEKPDADVVCRMLGYPSAEIKYCCSSPFGPPISTWLGWALLELKCVGTETSVFDCPARAGDTYPTCHSGQYAGVKCNTG